MPLLSFKKRFAGLVKSGRKRQTIRAFRKYPIYPGDTLYLYTGLRTKHTKHLRNVECVDTWNIKIWFNRPEIHLMQGGGTIFLNRPEQLNSFAQQDGFKDFEDMKSFWIAEHGVKKGNSKVILRPFTGILIKW